MELSERSNARRTETSTARSNARRTETSTARSLNIWASSSIEASNRLMSALFSCTSCSTTRKGVSLWKNGSGSASKGISLSLSPSPAAPAPPGPSPSRGVWPARTPPTARKVRVLDKKGTALEHKKAARLSLRSHLLERPDTILQALLHQLLHTVRVGPRLPGPRNSNSAKGQ